MKMEELNKLFRDAFIDAKKKFPEWHKDIIHAAAVLQEESGELLKASINFYFGRGTIEQVEKELGHTGAMVQRFGLDLEKYKSKKEIDERKEKEN